MTATIELALHLDSIVGEIRNDLSLIKLAAVLQASAQRLRELDKPDCTWHKVGETFDTACNARYRDGAYSTWKICPNCGGSIVKEST